MQYWTRILWIDISSNDSPRSYCPEKLKELKLVHIQQFIKGENGKPQGTLYWERKLNFLKLQHWHLISRDPFLPKYLKLTCDSTFALVAFLPDNKAVTLAIVRTVFNLSSVTGLVMTVSVICVQVMFGFTSAR